MTLEEMRARLTRPSAERIAIIKDEIAETAAQIIGLEGAGATKRRIDAEHALLKGLVAELSRCETALRAGLVYPIPRDTPAVPLRTGRGDGTCGWALRHVRADAATGTGAEEEARIAIGEEFARETGKQVAHVRRMRAGECAVGGSLCDLRFSPLLGGERAPARFLVYWQDGAPAGWCAVPIADELRGGRRGSVRRDVRGWLNSNARRGAVKVVEQWEITPEGEGWVAAALAFEDRTDAATFRLSWL